MSVSMSNKRTPNNTYTKKFKLGALRLMEQTDRQACAITIELGVRRN